MAKRIILSLKMNSRVNASVKSTVMIRFTSITHLQSKEKWISWMTAMFLLHQYQNGPHLNWFPLWVIESIKRRISPNAKVFGPNELNVLIEKFAIICNRCIWEQRSHQQSHHVNTAMSVHQHNHQYIDTWTQSSTAHQHFNTIIITSTHRQKHTNTLTRSSTHQHVNTSTRQHIGTSTRQHVNASTHQHISTSTHLHGHIIPPHEHINALTHQHSHQFQDQFDWGSFLLVCWRPCCYIYGFMLSMC